MIADDVHADEDHREPAEEPVEVERPRGAHAAGAEPGREQQAPHDARGEQRPRDDPAGAGRVPPELAGHRTASSVAPSVSAAQVDVVSSRRGRRRARRRRAVDQVEAATGVEERGLGQHLGLPALRRDRRRGEHRRARARARRGIDEVMLLDAVVAHPAPPQPRARRDRTVHAGGAGRNGTSCVPRALDRDPPRLTVRRRRRGRGDRRRRSRTRPSAPSVISSSATRSAASPLPIPPGSKPTPTGMRTVPAARRPRCGRAPVTQRGGEPARPAAEPVEALDVAGAQHRAEQRRVEPAARDRVTFERALHEQPGLGRHARSAARRPGSAGSPHWSG